VTSVGTTLSSSRSGYSSGTLATCSRGGGGPGWRGRCGAQRPQPRPEPCGAAWRPGSVHLARCAATSGASAGRGASGAAAGPAPHLHQALDLLVQVHLAVQEPLGLVRPLHAQLQVLLVLALERGHQAPQPARVQQLQLWASRGAAARGVGGCLGSNCAGQR
jgi:hypothetical protein